MGHLKHAELAGVDAKGIWLQLSDADIQCRVEVHSQHIVRVLFVRGKTLRQPTTWSITLEGSSRDPWGGWPRLIERAGEHTRGGFKVNQAPGVIRLHTGALTLLISLSPLHLTWLQSEVVFAADRPSHPYFFGRKSNHVRHYMERKQGDHYFGLGDKTGPLDLHGRRLRCDMTDALGYNPESGDPLYKNWPLLLTKDATTGVSYGVFYDNTSPSTFDLGCEHSNYYGPYRGYEAADGDLDYYLLLGPRLADVTRRFADLTGKMAFGPRWSLGYAATAMPLADAPDAQVQVGRFLDECQLNRIPCSAFHFGSGYTSIGPRRYVFNWNMDKFPDPKALIKRFKAANMRVVANLKPCLLNDHPRYAEAEASGAFIRNSETGRPSTSQFWDGEGAHLDFTTEAAVEWWQEGLRKSILEYGIDSAWNDNNEYELWDEEAECRGGSEDLDTGVGEHSNERVTSTVDAQASSKVEHRLAVSERDSRPMESGHAIPITLARPILALLMTRASYEEQLRYKPEERPYTITRAGGPGIQRYAQTWSGDNTTSWEHLRWNLRTGLQMSLSGMFNVGHDVGGFAGPSPDSELLVRWVQMGSLHPRCVTNSWKADGTVTTPWMHPPVTPFTRWALRLRYRLLPYLYTLYWRAAVDNEPIVRPTFFDFEEDEETFKDCDEMMLGPAILAAPVVEVGARARALYLPHCKVRASEEDRNAKGEGVLGWYDFYNGEWFSGGQIVTVAAPLERIPLLVVEGSLVPMTAEAENFNLLHDEPSRCVRVFPFRGKGKSVAQLYEDDGWSWGFREGDHCVLTLEMETSAEEIKITVACEGRYKLPYEELVFALPVAERRPLRLTTKDQGSLHLVEDSFRWH